MARRLVENDDLIGVHASEPVGRRTPHALDTSGFGCVACGFRAQAHLRCGRAGTDLPLQGPWALRRPLVRLLFNEFTRCGGAVRLTGSDGPCTASNACVSSACVSVPWQRGRSRKPRSQNCSVTRSTNSAAVRMNHRVWRQILPEGKHCRGDSIGASRQGQHPPGESRLLPAEHHRSVAGFRFHTPSGVVPVSSTGRSEPYRRRRPQVPLALSPLTRRATADASNRQTTTVSRAQVIEGVSKGGVAARAADRVLEHAFVLTAARKRL